MRFFKNILGKKDESITPYLNFWIWFEKNEKSFFKVVKSNKDIDEKFFDVLSPKLESIKDGFYFLTGMYDDKTVELIITADGDTKNIAFVEELIDAAPKLDRWKFTALKPPLDIENVNIEMEGFTFNRENLSFYANEFPDYPDEIDITIVHSDLTEENKSQIAIGVNIFLDNYLGELDFIANIDNLTILGRQDAKKELVPISKLKDFLNWRQKEFVEKYQDVRQNTENDNYSMLEAALEDGSMLIAIINTDLLDWDGKASHPWIAIFTIKYDGSHHNGMPGDDDFQLMETIEDDLAQELKDFDGYLSIGRQTGQSQRTIYYACNNFRLPSKVFFKFQQQFKSRFEIEYNIYKDKYWQTFNRFVN